MWAHQVIASIERNISKFPITGPFLIEEIEEAQKFHFGEIEAIPLTEATADEIRPLAEKYAKAPYEKCWFEYSRKGEETGTPMKCGFLFEFKRNTYEVLFLSHKNNSDLWIPAAMWKTNTDICKPEITLIDEILQSGLSPEKLMSIINDIYYVFLDLWAMLTFLNCKNVETERVNASQHRNKIRRDQGIVELFDYHILKIKKTGESQPSEISSGHNRLHLCRGHFKEYTKESPLLGKHTGLYWWEPHVRGQNKKGIVMKDYSVEGKDEE